MSHHLRGVLIGCLAVACLSTACASTSINRILSDPSRYRNDEVTISGSVTESVSIVDRGAYRIDDRSGQLWVVSTQGVPRKGARVTVKGTIRDAFDLGNLGGRLNLPPALASGLVLVENSHRAR